MRNYYQTNFALVHIHKWGSLGELDDLMPFERDIYLAMLIQNLKEEAERNREEAERQKNLQAKLQSQYNRKGTRR